MNGESNIPNPTPISIKPRLNARFRKMTPVQRAAELSKAELISPQDSEILASETPLPVEQADQMIENVVGVYGLPQGLVVNFPLNGRHYAVPLAIEEPSVVAALNFAALMADKSGGFQAQCDESLLEGQIQIIDCLDFDKAQQAVLANRDAILTSANTQLGNMVARGGGARSLRVEQYSRPNGDPMLVIYVAIDCCDAMGANLVNTACEAIAPEIESLTGGTSVLKILSNLTDKSIARARISIAPGRLAKGDLSGEQIRDRIVAASDLAAVDPYRAATHNKGIMNGIDALVIASGNDWRAIEAGAHAYAARTGRYSSLSSWSVGADGNLVGEIELPVKVGIVGAPIAANPKASVNLKLMGICSARELCELIAAIGLAQNFSAIRALAAEGIQKGHMAMHARSVATAAQVPTELRESVVRQMIAEGNIKVWRAVELSEQFQQDNRQPAAPKKVGDWQCANGKVILLGEHAVVYGATAIAGGIPNAVRARVIEGQRQSGVSVSLTNHFEKHSNPNHSPLLIQNIDLNDTKGATGDGGGLIEQSLRLMASKMALTNPAFTLEIESSIPAGMGLGGSAAFSVAVARALSYSFDLKLTDSEINAIAFDCEQIAHGTPSGIDNSLATWGGLVQFKKNANGDANIQVLNRVPKPLPLLIGITSTPGVTAKAVAQVRTAQEAHKARYHALFDTINQLGLAAIEAIAKGDFDDLGDLMNLNQGLLNGLRVSSVEQEKLIHLFRDAGAKGAKLTGSGQGGAVIALCPTNVDKIARQIRGHGFQVMEITLGE